MRIINPDPVKDKILQKIEARFFRLYAQYKEPTEYTTPSSEDIKESLKIWGVYISPKAVTKKAFRENKAANIREISLHLFSSEDPFVNETFREIYKLASKKYKEFPEEEKILAVLSVWWGRAGMFGNSSFRFLYLQFLKKNPTFKVGEETIQFSRNPFHRHNLRLLASNERLWQALKGLHSESSRPIVSWDSQKVRFEDRGAPRLAGKLTTIDKSLDLKEVKLGGGKSDLTKRHRDIYMYGGGEIDRIQAMIIEQHPKAISLGWVIFSNDSKIEGLIADYFGKKKGGFSPVEDKFLASIIDRWWRGPKGGFVVWKQATVHYEAEPTVDRKFKQFKSTTENLRYFSFRAVIGTHTPMDLKQNELSRLAYLSEKGWCPSIYFNKNRGTNVAKNVVNPKTTQFTVPRRMEDIEKESLEDTVVNYKNYDTFISKLDPIIREMYGIVDDKVEYISSFIHKEASKKNIEECLKITAKKFNITSEYVAGEIF